MIRRCAALVTVIFALASVTLAQDVGPLPAVGDVSSLPLDKVPAKKLFASKRSPADLKARSIGFYSRGCLAGGVALPINGPAWQVMRLSRNRNWGHPKLIALLEQLADEAQLFDGWNGLLVGDISQPRGGPMLTGHASHQIGLDADIWLMPMPNNILTTEERESIKAVSMVKDYKTLNTAVWTEAHAKLIKRAASFPQVDRIFVHPPIKGALCRWATGDRSWLAKVRPYYGHDYHFHIRIGCPNDQAGCRDQPAARPVDGTGCGKDLAYWYGKEPWRQKPPPKNPPKPAPPLTLKALPAECRAVVMAP
jgi:penicillin-insensitive murein endopeptidase